MGNFRSNNRSEFRNKYGGSRFGGRSRRDRDSERFDRMPEMHDAICSKCGKRCQVPFKPTGSKPVFCSDCFRQNEGSDNNFASRNQARPSQSNISSEQFNKLNAKLDKILLVLQDLELDMEDDLDEDSNEDLQEDSEDGAGDEIEDESEDEILDDSEKDL